MRTAFRTNPILVLPLVVLFLAAAGDPTDQVGNLRSSDDGILPSVPVVLDGKWYDVKELKPMYNTIFVLPESESGYLYAFSSWAAFDKFVEESGWGGGGQTAVLATNATFWRDTYYSNCSLNTGTDQNNLVSVGCGCCGDGEWNDDISSLSVGSQKLCLVTDSAPCSGSALCASSWATIPTLVPYGWNDRASCIDFL